MEKKTLTICNESEDFCYTVNDDSLKLLNLFPGDTIFVKTKCELEHGDLVLIKDEKGKIRVGYFFFGRELYYFAYYLRELDKVAMTLEELEEVQNKILGKALLVMRKVV